MRFYSFFNITKPGVIVRCHALSCTGVRCTATLVALVHTSIALLIYLTAAILHRNYAKSSFCFSFFSEYFLNFSHSIRCHHCRSTKKAKNKKLHVMLLFGVDNIHTVFKTNTWKFDTFT